MRALIVGIQGFCGRHLADRLARRGAELLGIDLAVVDPDQGWPRLAAEIRPGDVRQGDFVRDCIEQFRPQQVYHLAGLTAEPGERQARRALYEINVMGTLNVLEAAASVEPMPTVLIASSSAVYAESPAGELPLRETSPLAPRNHYGVTKLAQEAMGHVYARQRGLSVLLARSFNIIGPGQGSAFVTASLARQIVEAELGLAPARIVAGNLEPQRDFVDVRDVVLAFERLMEQGQPGEAYNICSGRPVTVGQVLETLLRQSALAGQDVPIERQAQRIRAADEVYFHYGDSAKLRQRTGWSPQFTLEQSLIDLMDYWRRRLPDERR